MRAQFSSLVLASAIAGLATVPQVLATGSADAAEDVASAPSKVVSLTGDTFKDFINEHELVLAEFFAPWCGHCKALAPEYDIAAEELAELGIPLVKVDCTVEKNLCEEHEVPGYPTLKVFKGLDQVKRYRGVRKAPALTSFMRRQALPTVTHVDTAEQLKGFQALDNITVVGFISADDKDSLETFTRVADNLRDSYPFSVTTAAAIADAELDGAKLPSIALYKNFDEGKAV
ncbi:protein disulfide-isomerase precursor, partial [Ascosphaera acerosa]